MRLIMNISSQTCVVKGPVSSTEIFRGRGIMNSHRTMYWISYIAIPSWCFCEQSAALLRGVLTDS